MKLSSKIHIFGVRNPKCSFIFQSCTAITIHFIFLECQDIFRDCKEWLLPTLGCDKVGMGCRKSCQLCGKKQ